VAARATDCDHHGTAFTATEFATMAEKGMTLTWSPALYGKTADIPAALTAVTVALAPDWSMGGSQNLLDEMHLADFSDNGHWNNILAAKDLVLMATSNAAAVLALTIAWDASRRGPSPTWSCSTATAATATTPSWRPRPPRSSW
jgi:cytosine/adenosine deaminase-related metal-dependent hydrolase